MTPMIRQRAPFYAHQISIAHWIESKKKPIFKTLMLLNYIY